MSMPPLDEKLALEALIQLVELEQEWIPIEKGTSLYIRPFVIATEPSLGVRPSKRYKFMVVLTLGRFVLRRSAETDPHLCGG